MFVYTNIKCFHILPDLNPRLKLVVFPLVNSRISPEHPSEQENLISVPLDPTYTYSSRSIYLNIRPTRS